MAVGSREPAARRRQDTRARIVQSALELFGRHGFDGTTVKAIGERCGLSDAALYYHFRSKRDILDSLWDTSGKLDIDPPSTHEPLDGEGLARLTTALIENCASHDSLLRLIVRQVLAGDRTAIALRNQAMAQWRSQLLPHFELSLDRECASLRVEALTMLVLGLVFTAQITHGDAFRAVARSDEFLRHATEMARVVAPLPTSGGA